MSLNSMICTSAFQISEKKDDRVITSAVMNRTAAFRKDMV